MHIFCYFLIFFIFIFYFLNFLNYFFVFLCFILRSKIKTSYYFPKSHKKSGVPVKKETDPPGIISLFQAGSHLKFSFTHLV